MTLTSPDGITAGLVERPGLETATGCCGNGFPVSQYEPITFDDGGLSDPEQISFLGGPYYSAGGFDGPPDPRDVAGKMVATIKPGTPRFLG
jgi:hypothetical protein